MKDEKLNEVLQNMLPYLDNAQMDQLKKVLQAAFWNCSITEKSGNGVLEETNEKVKYLHRERRRTKLQRGIYLEDINKEAIEAKMDNGILTIKVPKLAEAAKKLSIAIQ